MYLRPMDGTSPAAWPGEVATGDGKARITFVDDLPVMAAEGGARFEVKRRSRLPWRRRPIVVEATAGTPVRLAKGDVVTLVGEGAGGAWRYDPDANLGRVGRAAMGAARVGTALAVVASLGVLASEHLLYAATLYYGGSRASGEISELVRRNAPKVYRAKGHEPSAYMRALIDARKAKQDLGSASETWIKDHPLAQGTSGTTP